jgi:phosphoribosyl 1,2-cyclic phosphate phosphodiesterase
MRLTFLGTGTSFGVPVIGCACRTCTSRDPRDRRTRHGAVLETGGARLLIDTPPELRLQLLAAGIESIEAIWFTHAHADHIHGIDDVRIFTVKRGDMQAYVAAAYRPIIEEHFRYIFDPKVLPPEGSSKPRIHLQEIAVGRPVEIIGETFLPLVVPHGGVDVYGFRVGPLGYVTDAKFLPSEAVDTLRGVDVLVLNALWFGKPHASHFNIEEAIEASLSVGARRTYLTHLTHRVLHTELEEKLPAGVYAAFDGLTVEIG